MTAVRPVAPPPKATQPLSMTISSALVNTSNIPAAAAPKASGAQAPAFSLLGGLATAVVLAALLH